MCFLDLATDALQTRRLQRRLAVHSYPSTRRHTFYDAPCAHLAAVDWFAVVPRRLAERFFSLGHSFLRCQHRELNQHFCSGAASWDWAAPECIMKVHLSLCLGAAATFVRAPPWFNSTAPLPMTEPAALQLASTLRPTTALTTPPAGVSQAEVPALAPTGTPAEAVRHTLHRLGASLRDCLTQPRSQSTVSSPADAAAPPGGSTTSTVFSDVSAVVVVSSMPLRYLVSGLQKYRATTSNDVAGTPRSQDATTQGAGGTHLVASCLSLKIPLYVTYDPDPTHVLPSSLPPLVTAEDIFDAIPGLRRLLQVRNKAICLGSTRKLTGRA